MFYISWVCVDGSGAAVAVAVAVPRCPSASSWLLFVVCSDVSLSSLPPAALSPCAGRRRHVLHLLFFVALCVQSAVSIANSQRRRRRDFVSAPHRAWFPFPQTVWHMASDRSGKESSMTFPNRLRDSAGLVERSAELHSCVCLTDSDRVARSHKGDFI